MLTELFQLCDSPELGEISRKSESWWVFGISVYLTIGGMCLVLEVVARLRCRNYHSSHSPEGRATWPKLENGEGPKCCTTARMEAKHARRALTADCLSKCSAKYMTLKSFLPIPSPTQHFHPCDRLTAGCYPHRRPKGVKDRVDEPHLQCLVRRAMLGSSKPSRDGNLEGHALPFEADDALTLTTRQSRHVCPTLVRCAAARAIART